MPSTKFSHFFRFFPFLLPPGRFRPRGAWERHQGLRGNISREFQAELRPGDPVRPQIDVFRTSPLPISELLHSCIELLQPCIGLASPT